jgi:hypothetical protein
MAAAQALELLSCRTGDAWLQFQWKIADLIQEGVPRSAA